MYRLHADGSPDLSFNGGGYSVTMLTPSLEHTYGLVLQPDGKMVVAGSSNLGYVLIRYNDDGTYDTAFGGGDGIATHTLPNLSGASTARSVALQPDGKIVVATHNGTGFLVARHLPDDALDPTFDGDGFGPVMSGIETTVVGCVLDGLGLCRHAVATGR